MQKLFLPQFLLANMQLGFKQHSFPESTVHTASIAAEIRQFHAFIQATRKKINPNKEWKNEILGPIIPVQTINSPDWNQLVIERHEVQRLARMQQMVKNIGLNGLVINPPEHHLQIHRFQWASPFQ